MERRGRKAKGERRKVVAAMPAAAAERVHAEAVGLGCFIGDYLGWLVADELGFGRDVPMGNVSDHPLPSRATDGRLRCAAMVPEPVAEVVMSRAETRGITMGDLVAELVCTRFEVPFSPRVMKKARRDLSTGGGQLPMTG